MKITLVKATENDITELHEIQVEAFKSLLEKYHDYTINPGAETIEQDKSNRDTSRLSEQRNSTESIYFDRENVLARKWMDIRNNIGGKGELPSVFKNRICEDRENRLYKTRNAYCLF